MARLQPFGYFHGRRSTNMSLALILVAFVALKIWGPGGYLAPPAPVVEAPAVEAATPAPVPPVQRTGWVLPGRGMEVVLSREGALVVHVEPGGRAEGDGVAPGDRVLSCDGERVDVLGLDGLQACAEANGVLRVSPATPPAGEQPT